MIKLFFITFFAAELIIALTLIFKIYGLNKSVNAWNKLILSNKDSIKANFSELHSIVADFSQSIIDVKNYIEEKRKEYTLNFIQTLLSYTAIFMLRGKYKKAILTYQLFKEFYEGFTEA